MDKEILSDALVHAFEKIFTEIKVIDGTPNIDEITETIKEILENANTDIGFNISIIKLDTDEGQTYFCTINKINDTEGE